MHPPPISHTCTRKIEFDSAHRVMRHESKCRNLHGHRYVAEFTATGALDPLGRIIDFSVLKAIVGKWVDDNWDHGVILNTRDAELVDFVLDQGWKCFEMQTNPTAETMAEFLCHKSNNLLADTGVTVVHVRLYETPNCWADFRNENC